MPGLPRTNNELESHFRDTRRRLLRTTGQQGQTQRTLQRQGAWELLAHPPTEAKLQEALQHIPPRTWRRNGSVLRRIASASACRVVPETDSSAIRATALVVQTTAYRHRVTFAVLRISCTGPQRPGETDAGAFWSSLPACHKTVRL